MRSSDAQPFTAVITPEGRVVSTYAGYAASEQLEQDVRTSVGLDRMTGQEQLTLQEE